MIAHGNASALSMIAAKKMKCRIFTSRSLISALANGHILLQGAPVAAFIPIIAVFFGRVGIKPGFIERAC